MTALRPVLVIEDDAALRATLVEHLVEEGCFAVEEADSTSEARAKLDREGGRYDAVLLDIGLPDGNGRELCAQLRGAGRNMPIILLTGQSGEDDIVQGLDAGANDYIAKPFRIAEMMARLRAQLRTFDNSPDVVFNIGPYEFRPAVRMLVERARNRKIRLTAKEADLLKYMIRLGGRIASREALMKEVWGYNATVSTHTLETHIYRLRQKIEPTPGDPTLLTTVPGGYVLNSGSGPDIKV